VASFRLRQPDATIATIGAAIGDGVYNTTGASQAKARTIARGASGTFTIKVTNAGLFPDDITIGGPGSSAGFTATYTVGATNVTAVVVAGTYLIGGLAPGASRTITLKVVVGHGAAKGAERALLVKATSSAAGSPEDAVKATVTAS